MWHCAIRSEFRRAAAGQVEGVALVAAILAIGLLSAVALGMAIVASTEPAVAANTEGILAAVCAADAGLAIAAIELQDIPDWTAVLSGAVGSAALARGDTSIDLPDGRRLDLARHTNVLNCGRPTGCTAARLDESTADRPWGRNNPRWRLYGEASTAELWGSEGSAPPFALAVWVADDPAEHDSMPSVDGGAEDGHPSDGRGIMAIRAESFGPRGAHAARAGTVVRLAGETVVRLANQGPGT